MPTRFDDGVLAGDAGNLISAMTTGIMTGGEVTINGGDSSKFDVAAGVGIVVNNHTDPRYPTITKVEWSAFSAQTITALATDPVTFVAINSSGAIVQQTTEFANEDYRDLIVLAIIGHPNHTSISSIEMHVVTAFNQNLDSIDFMHAFGPFKLSGLVLTANGANLNVDRSSGTAWHRGANYANSKKRPSVVDISAAAAFSWFYIYADGSGGHIFTTPTSAVDPDQYDDGSGTLASVPTDMWTIQRFFILPGQATTAVHYGQATYNSAEAAFAGRDDENDDTLPQLDEAVFIGWAAVKQGATDLSDTSQALFRIAGRFGLTDIQSGAGQGEANIASNVGTAGVGVFKTKSGVNLQFKNINAGSSKVSITDDTGNDEIDIDVVEANFAHLDGGANKHDASEIDVEGTLANAASTPTDLETTLGELDAAISATGFQGNQGNQGNQGFQGNQGNQGLQGTAGTVGVQGPQGNQGNQGNMGVPGVQGPQGNQGNVGNTGTTGPQGNQGWQGIGGIQGFQGPQGNQGNVGSTGTTGPQGNQGWQGWQGPNTASTTLATATGDTTTSSTTDVLVNSMTLTPASGTYLVWFSGSVEHTTNNATIETSVYAGGTQNASSERRYMRGGGGGATASGFCCVAQVTVNGSQAIEGRWRTPDGATATMHERTLAILKVA